MVESTGLNLPTHRMGIHTVEYKIIKQSHG
jgi:hypothetical protein